MESRVCVLGAGSGPGNNLIRSLRAGAPRLFIVGCHSSRFVLKQSSADRNYLIPGSGHPTLLDSLCRIVERERIDLLIPNSDPDVKALAGREGQIPCRLFLPRPPVVDLCQDKYELTRFLGARGLPVPLTYPVAGAEGLEGIFRLLVPHTRLWCRVRTGSGGLGAALVSSPEQARVWIRLWEEMRGIPPGSFTLSEYLPGRDFACQSLWDKGRLILIKTYERISYLGASGQPSGLSIAALSKTVCEPRVAEVCERAIRALDPEASGVFVFDLKENGTGVACVTEINAGRFGMSTNIFDLPGKHNMAATYVRVALGEPVAIGDVYDAVEDYYMVRDFDTLPGIYHADELFDGMEEARS